ncbi:phosphohistidine phosphatase SixA [Alteromonadaceae bacterium 2753L.S.0a.02]|nr:phosphohistidine phosphatase SixA [Alteromonadaceae bacterium 2753L.S.0a.02]
MKLFILRHGEAEFSLTSDFDRELTSQGRTQVTAITLEAAQELRQVEHIYVSPLVRAQQTAVLVKSQIGDRPTSTVSWLTPDTATPSAISELAEIPCDQANAVLLVSHLPFVADFVDGLCGNPIGTSRFATASMALLETDIIAAGCADVIWMKHVQ